MFSTTSSFLYFSQADGLVFLLQKEQDRPGGHMSFLSFVKNKMLVVPLEESLVRSGTTSIFYKRNGHVGRPPNLGTNQRQEKEIVSHQHLFLSPGVCF